MFLAILFSVSFMCSFHVKCRSNKTPGDLIVSSANINGSNKQYTYRLGRLHSKNEMVQE